MVDLEILAEFGGTDERLEEIFTSKPPKPVETKEARKDGDNLKKRYEENFKVRTRFEKYISRVMSEQVNFTLKNYQIYSAVDLAWEPPPISPELYPLVLYAQGKLDRGECIRQLKTIPDGHGSHYITKDQRGQEIPTPPKLTDVSINLVRTIITRRLAAQANKYSSLYPHYKFEARGTSSVDKLRADVVSQIMDIQSDWFGHPQHDEQVFRDTMLYAHCLDFVQCAWQRETTWERDGSISPELIESGKIPKKVVIVKEGVPFINPHISRTYFDNASPLSEINPDIGPKYCGFWDVLRAGDVITNPQYWNRTELGYSSTIVNLFQTYAQYFSQYLCTIQVPDCQGMDLSSDNDRLNNIGRYSQDSYSDSMIVGQHYQRLVPKDWGICEYPYPVWMRFTVAGYNTIIFAEFLPSSPCAYAGYNERDGRQVNLSLAHELLGLQDQLTNLCSLLLMCIKSDSITIVGLDTDSLNEEQQRELKTTLSGKNYYAEPVIFPYSGSKLRDLGIDPTKLFWRVQGDATKAIPVIFNAIDKVFEWSERLSVISKTEQAQPAPSGISATESNAISGTTESIYGFLSDAFDRFRAAKKRILYESYMACGNKDFTVPVTGRYSRKVVQLAGLEVLEDGQDIPNEEGTTRRFTVTGSKWKLAYNYIFTSRDGALRAVNTQAANVLTQLLGILKDPVVMQAIGKEKYFEIINEIFRLSGAGVDMKLEVKEGESDAMGVDVNQQIQQVLQQLTQQVEALDKGEQQVNQEVTQIVDELKTLTEEVKRLSAEAKSQPKNNAAEDAATLMRAEEEVRRSREESAMKRRQFESEESRKNASTRADLGLTVLKAANEESRASDMHNTKRRLIERPAA